MVTVKSTLLGPTEVSCSNTSKGQLGSSSLYNGRRMFATLSQFPKVKRLTGVILKFLIETPSGEASYEFNPSVQRTAGYSLNLMAVYVIYYCLRCFRAST